MSTAKELRTKMPDELRRMRETLRGELRSLRFKVASRQAKGTHAMGEMRKEIARIETVLQNPTLS